VKYFPRVLKYLRPYWKLAVCSVLLIGIAALVGLLVPWPLKILVDQVLQNQPVSNTLASLTKWLPPGRFPLLVFAVLAGFALAILQNGLTVLDNYVNTKLHQSIALDFRSDIFQHAQRLSCSYHDQKRSGMVIYAINSQGDAVARLIMIVPQLGQSLFTLAGMFWITFTMDRSLALLSLTVVPVLYYSVGYYMTHIQSRLVRVLAMEGESLSIVHESISMMRVIVAFGRESHEFRRFRDQGKRTIDARIDVTVRQTAFSLVVNSTTAAGTALVLGFGAYHVMQHRLTVGQLLVVMAYIAAVYQPLQTISTTVGSLQEISAALKIAYDVLDIEPDVKDQPSAVAMRRAQGRVEFEDVHFSYKGRRDTLKEVSFTVEPGQVTAIVGPTGAGKTTLVSLLPRFYEPDRGRVLLDGLPVERLKLRSLRDQISIVLQEPLLFSASIAENIQYGRLDASRGEIIDAARAANAHDFIMALPNQYETQIGERGAQLSGGERQRIAIARAFLKNAPILILDEPTSSIDSKTEAVILDALDSLMVGRTTFMIAHRLSTIRRADNILVMDQGAIVQRGSHGELMRHRGLYRQLHDLQGREGKVVLAPAEYAGMPDTAL
jgi:ATP-binding cassette subfamily B protein